MGMSEREWNLKVLPSQVTGLFELRHRSGAMASSAHLPEYWDVRTVAPVGSAAVWSSSVYSVSPT